MYHKLFSTPTEKFYARVIRSMAQDTLSAKELNWVINAYQKRIIDDPNFNGENFFLELKGFLRYYRAEKRNEKKSISSVAKEFHNPLRISVREKLLRRYGYESAIPCKDDGHAKKSYLILERSKVVRFYFARPLRFFYCKLLGVSETDINNALGNRLLTAASKNIVGEPMDVMERALPLSDVFASLKENQQKRIIWKIEKARNTNPLITDFIENKNKNVGLVVRCDNCGKKRVYVVAFDLDLRIRHLTEESEQEVLKRMVRECSSVQPDSLDYDYLVKYIPQLKELVAPLVGRSDK